MSWVSIIVLVVGAYGFKVFGVLGLGRVADGAAARVEPLTSLIPAALFAALIVVQTVAGDEALVLDARVVGVGVGAVAVWRRAPFVIVVVVAMTATALVRWQT
ncbi:MAG: AzlD domain-containing protein [Acidimicrobiales bacterium]|nr:AzlD domain-containing protein [Acidimicrobiales bacterium]